MEKLKIGDQAPDFAVIDINGKTIRLADYRGSRVLLTFYRFVGCPFCSIHFSRMQKEAERFEHRGLKILSVFESESEYLKEYMSSKGMPFVVIGDPHGLTYRQYAVEKSLKGVMVGMIKQLPKVIKIMFGSEYRYGKPGGELRRIPAEFIIDEQGYILDVYYGKNAGDAMPISQIEKRLPNEVDLTKGVKNEKQMGDSMHSPLDYVI